MNPLQWIYVQQNITEVTVQKLTTRTNLQGCYQGQVSETKARPSRLTGLQYQGQGLQFRG